MCDCAVGLCVCAHTGVSVSLWSRLVWVFPGSCVQPRLSPQKLLEEWLNSGPLVGQQAWCAGPVAAESGHPGPNLSRRASHHCSVRLLTHRQQPAGPRTRLGPVPQERALC